MSGVASVNIQVKPWRVITLFGFEESTEGGSPTRRSGPIAQLVRAHA